MRTNIITAAASATTTVVTSKAYQYDYGLRLEVTGLTLPNVTEWQFANDMSGKAAETTLGDSTGVDIPNDLLISGEHVYAWLFVHSTVNDGYTAYTFDIPVIQRTRPVEEEPTPEQAGLISQAIAALNQAVSDTTQAAADAEASEQSAAASAESANTDATAAHADMLLAHAAAESASGSAAAAYASENTAKNYAQNAASSASSASGSANSAYTFKRQAETAKADAETAAGNAASSATAASLSVTGAANSATAAANSANTASEKADDASTSATNAANSAADAATSALEASGYKTDAGIYAGNASSSATSAASSAATAQQTVDGAIDAIEAKGAEVIESIPEDYTELSADVTQLKSDFDELSDGLYEENQLSGGMVKINNPSDGTVKQVNVGAQAGTTASVITRCGKNIYPKYPSGSANNLSWTVANDGTITFTGTPSADTLIRMQNLSMPVHGVTCAFSFFNNMTDSRLSFFAINVQNTGNYQINMSSVNATGSETLTLDLVELRIRVPKDFNATGLTLKPMMVVGDSTGDFEEYIGQTYSVTLVDGVVQENISLLDGINTLWASNGDITIAVEKASSVVDYVTGEIDKTIESFYRFETSGSARYLYIIYKSGNNYVRWQLHNVPALASNSNTWQIGRICGLDADMKNLTEIVRGGEFELAFKEHGAADYCGGNNHGDETTDVFKLFIDGKQITDLSTLDGNMHPFTRIDAFEIATVNRCDTPSEDILKHEKIWTFEDGKVTVRQTFKFLEELEVDGMLVCMFAALRSAFPYGIRKGGVAIEDMTSATFEKVGTVSDDVFYEYYGTVATAKIHAKTDNPENKSYMWINNTIDLNKLYYGYYGTTDSSHPTTVPINTVITAESEYDVAYTPAES